LTTSLAGVRQSQNSFSSTTNYSFADSVTTGPTGGPQLTTTYSYNTAQGQLSAVTDPNGQQVRYTYDSMGRVNNVFSPDTSTVSTTYDDSNHKITVTRSVDSSHSVATIQASDPLGNLLTTTVQDSS